MGGQIVMTLYSQHEVDDLLAHLPAADRPSPIARTIHGVNLFSSFVVDALSAAKVAAELEAERLGGGAHKSIQRF